MHELDHNDYNSQSLTLLTASLVTRYVLLAVGRAHWESEAIHQHSSLIARISIGPRGNPESDDQSEGWMANERTIKRESRVRATKSLASGGQHSINHHCAYSSSHWERQYNAVQRGRGKYFVCWWILPSSLKKDNNGIQITLKINEEKQREIDFYFYNPTLTRSSPDRQLLDFLVKSLLCD